MKQSRGFFQPGKQIQPKLTVNAPDDKYEQEADAIADKVIGMPGPQISRKEEEEEEMLQLKEQAPAIHRKCNACEVDVDLQKHPMENEGMMLKPTLPGVHRKCAECESEEKLQRRPLAGSITPFFQRKEAGGREVGPRERASLQSTKGGGRTLPENTRSWMESRFGADFSGVRVHTGSNAVQLSRDLNAKAFTHGRDIYFNSGEFSPGTCKGKQLLAHELTHVVQQSQKTETNINAIQCACGSVGVSSVQQCIGRGGDIYDFGYSSTDIYLFTRNCDDFQAGEENRLRRFAASLEPDDRVEIDGFASEEGSAGYNMELSCARAFKAGAVFSQAGLTSDRINLYRHGATEGPRNERRSAVITLIKPALEPPQEDTSEITVKVEFNAYIPGSLGTWLDEPGPTGCEYKTDERGFGDQGTSRIHKEGHAMIGKTVFLHCDATGGPGPSHRRCREYPPPAGPHDADYSQPGGWRWTYSSDTTAKKGFETAQCHPCHAHFHFIGEASYPYIDLSPDIDFNVDVYLIATGSGLIVRFQGEHNRFPAYEGIVEIDRIRTVLYRYFPSDSGPDPVNLNTSKDIPSGTERIFNISVQQVACPQDTLDRL